LISFSNTCIQDVKPDKENEFEKLMGLPNHAFEVRFAEYRINLAACLQFKRLF